MTTTPERDGHSHPSAETDEPTEAAPRRRRRLTALVSIQSKLLVMLLLTCIVSSGVVGLIGYQSGRSSLREAAFDRLTEIRQSQSRQLEAQIQDLKDSLLVYSRGETATEAVDAFTAGFEQLATATVTSAQQQSIVDYYTKRFAVDKKAQTGESVNVALSLPTSTAQQYLQALYTAPFGAYGQPEEDWQKAIDFDDARDGSAWSAANARFNDFFRLMVTRFAFEDALLLDTRGNVVYSAYKGVDLGTNILDGPYKGSDLNGAYRAAVDSDSLDYVGVTDFGQYRPATEPTAWFVSPVGRGGRIDGVMALQFPASKINEMMTMDGRWRESGMGETGETFIVGPDNLMRSNSRLFVEDPKAYEEDVVAAGTPPDVAKDAIRQNGTTLVQPIATGSAKLAQQGRSGTLIADDYLGDESLQAYGPVDIPGLRWGVVASIDTAEAFAPVKVFTRDLVLSTATIIFLVCIAAMLLARWFVRPIRRLESGAREISSGEYGTTIPVVSRDEFGDLTGAFNDMSRNLAVKDGQLTEQMQENERIMRAQMPEKVVARYRGGEETIAQDHQGVTVVFSEVVGLDELTHGVPTEESLAIVNGLVRQFDAAADSLGIERIRNLRNGYLACCGLNVPRIDHVRRTVDFAVEMQRIVDRFNGEADQSLRLRVGIGTGRASSGLVGRASPAYDVWGDAVDLALHVQSGSPQPGIYVTTDVYDAVRSGRDFTPAGEVAMGGEIRGIWRLALAQR